LYKRYQGNSGRVQRIEEERGAPRQRERPEAAPAYRPPLMPPPAQKPPGPLSGLSGELGRLLERISLEKMETEDLILLLVLYLLYKESGDEEFLIMMALMVIL